MFKWRTDLAMERLEAHGEAPLPGVTSRSWQQSPLSVHRIEVLDERGEQALERPRGRYLTAQMEEHALQDSQWIYRSAKVLSKLLLPLLPREGAVLVAGLGNRAVTPDALGPLTLEHVIVTRHLRRVMPSEFGNMRPVCALSAGVLGTTGVESGSLIRAVCDAIRPACVIAVDALASRSLHRVCRTVQLADTGIVPGSGVGNHRKALNRETLGIPVIAVGVPTVVDGATLAMDLLGHEEPPELARGVENLMVTPRDIDSQVADLSKVIGFGINLALHKGLSVEDVELFLS